MGNRAFVVAEVKQSRALDGTSSQSYWMSLAIWDHTVLPFTRHKWTHPNNMQLKDRPVLDLPTPEGLKAELTWVTCYIPRWFTRLQTVTHPSTNTVLPPTQHKWTQPALTPARGRYSIYLPRRDGRLSWTSCLEHSAGGDNSIPVTCNIFCQMSQNLATFSEHHTEHHLIDASVLFTIYH